MNPRDIRKQLISKVVIAPQEEERFRAQAGFDWAGIVCGHWYITRAQGQNKHGTTLWHCISRCGVVAWYTGSQLATGGPATCEACRVGVAPPSTIRTIHESELNTHQLRWEKLMNVRSNLKGKEAISDWEEFGLPLLDLVLKATPMGINYGWALFVRDCHQSARPKGNALARVKSHHFGQRRIELVLRPIDGRYSFDVDVTIGRNDNFEQLVKAFQDAGASMGTNQEEEAKATPPNTNGSALAKAVVGVDLDRLLMIRSGLDRLHIAGTHLKTVAEEKAAAQLRLAAAEAEEQRLKEQRDSIRKEHNAWVNEHDALFAQVRELSDKLRATEKAMNEAEQKIEQTRKQEQEIAPIHAIAKEAADFARLEVEEAQKAEERHTRALAEGDEMAPLLAALAKLASSK